VVVVVAGRVVETPGPVGGLVGNGATSGHGRDGCAGSVHIPDPDGTPRMTVEQSSAGEKTRSSRRRSSSTSERLLVPSHTRSSSIKRSGEPPRGMSLV
jgi:hypothetical protein